MSQILEIFSEFSPKYNEIAASFYWLRPIPLFVFVCCAFIYFKARNLRIQNAILLGLAAYVAWNTSIIFFMQLFSYAAVQSVITIKIHNSKSEPLKKLLLGVSLVLGLFVVVFLRSPGLQDFVIEILARFNIPGIPKKPVQNFFIISVPVFTIFTLAVDAYYGRIHPAPTFVKSMIFSTFFSRYSALPVERARDVIPKYYQLRQWDGGLAEEGLWSIANGLVKISVFNGYSQVLALLNGTHGYGLALLSAYWLSAIQSWLAFSGGIDLTIGFARILGIRIPPNFDAPFLCTNVADFWRRWNTGFMMWLGEEIFARVAFATRRWGLWGTGAACFLTFAFSALGHVVSAGSLLWGGVWGVFFLAYLANRKRIRKFAKKHGDPFWFKFLSWLVNSHIVVLIWGLWEAKSFSGFIESAGRLFSGPVWSTKDVAVNWMAFILAAVVTVYLHNKPHFSQNEFWMVRLASWKKVGLLALMILSVFVYNNA